MAKMIIIALTVVGLAQFALADFEASCAGIEQISFAAMQQEDNQCHFLVKKGGVVAKDPASLEASDVVQTCACNILNKGYVWAGFNTEAVKKLNEIIDNRIFVMGLEAPSDKASIGDLLALPQDQLQAKLIAPTGEYESVRAKDELPSEEIKKTCVNLVSEFDQFDKMFSNLNSYMGSNDLSSVIVSSNWDLKKSVRAYKVCRVANFSL